MLFDRFKAFFADPCSMEFVWNRNQGIPVLAGSLLEMAGCADCARLCAPCFAAMGAIRREMNNEKWFWFAIGYQTALPYAVSFCIYQIGTMLATASFGPGTIVAVLRIFGFLFLLLRPYHGSNALKMNIKGTRRITAIK